MTAKRDTLYALGLILALTAAAYLNSLGAEFHFDDLHQVSMNENIRSMGNIPTFFTDAGLASHYSNLKGYRPLTSVSFAVNYAVSGYNVSGYHLFNIFLHILNACLVYIIVKSVLQEGGRDKGAAAPLLAAVLFAVHPIQTGAVTYISGRAVLLAASFYLLALYCFLRYRAGGSASWAVLPPVFFFLGLFCKEIVVSLPFLMAAYDITLAPKRAGGALKQRRAWLYYVPFTLALLVYFTVRRVLAGYFTAPAWDYGVAQYLMSEAKTLLMYLRLMVLPVNQNADYFISPVNDINTAVVVSAVLVFAALFLLYRQRVKRPAVAFFGLWFFIALAPESSFIPIKDIAVEYRLYLPSIGLIAALLLLVRGAIIKPAARKAAATAVVALLMALTVSRNTVWADEYVFWGDIVKKSPRSARAHANMGTILLGKGRCREALLEFRKSLEVDPVYTESYYVYNNMGVCYNELGQLGPAADKFSEATRANPGSAEAYKNLGLVYEKMGRLGEAADALAESVRIAPGEGEVRQALARCYREMGKEKEAAQTIEDARK